MKRGFDTEKYLFAQSAEIEKRVRKFDRLYLEVGGKLLSDNHAARVLPGYKRTCKVDILKELGDLEIVYCINAKDLKANGFVGRYGLSVKEKAEKDLEDLRVLGFEAKVVITRFDRGVRGEVRAVRDFVRKIKKMGLKVYFLNEIDGYGEIKRTLIGYARHKLIPLKEDLIIVTGVGGGSGKMGFALSQIYKEMKKKIKVGFAKFESFPIWNLPLTHPINLAYEAGTADLGDYNMIDPFYLRAYKKKAVNYNRDIENFHILKRMMKAIDGKLYPFGYKSPTDMGVNMMRMGIVDDAVCRRAARVEIERRLDEYVREAKLGKVSDVVVKRAREVYSRSLR